MCDATVALRRALLQWITERPRTYGEAMEAWRTACPRMTIWEDALLDGLIELQRGPTRDEARVDLTSAGRLWLDGSAAPN